VAAVGAEFEEKNWSITTASHCINNIVLVFLCHQFAEQNLLSSSFQWTLDEACIERLTIPAYLTKLLAQDMRRLPFVAVHGHDGLNETSGNRTVAGLLQYCE